MSVDVSVQTSVQTDIVVKILGFSLCRCVIFPSTGDLRFTLWGFHSVTLNAAKRSSVSVGPGFCWPHLDHINISELWSSFSSSEETCMQETCTQETCTDYRWFKLTLCKPAESWTQTEPWALWTGHYSELHTHFSFFSALFYKTVKTSSGHSMFEFFCSGVQTCDMLQDNNKNTAKIWHVKVQKSDFWSKLVFFTSTQK